MLGLSDEEAILNFREKIQEARQTTTYRKFDNWFHQVSNRMKARKDLKVEEEF